MKIHFFYPFVIILLVLLPIIHLYGQAPSRLILQMIDSASVLQGFTAEITKEERIEGTMVKQISSVKLKHRPFQLYLRQLYPHDGIEVLVRPDHEKALVNPNTFPWFNLHLDPYGMFMRKEQHHTVYDSGFDLMSNLLKHEIERMGPDTSSHVFYEGLVDWEGRPTHHVKMVYHEYGTQMYRVVEGDDLNTIAGKLHVSEYRILEMNENIDDYEDIEAGQEIKVPTNYGETMSLYIDTEYMLPLMISVYDDDGLYEQYSYRKFRLNPEFKKNEFASDYKDYDF